MTRSIRTGYMLAGAVLAIATVVSFNALTPAKATDTTRTQAVEAGPISASDISDEQAHVIIAAAIEKAREIDTKMDIAIVDAGGNLKAFMRMEDAWLGSIDIAIKKAKTARYFDMNTGDIGELSQPGGPALQHRTLQRRADHLPRRRAPERRQRQHHRRDRRVRLLGRKRPHRRPGWRGRDQLVRLACLLPGSFIAVLRRNAGVCTLSRPESRDV